MAYIFNMVQHTVEGDVIAPALTYEKELDWKAQYHQEMSYAIASENILGIDITVSDSNLYMVFSDHLTKPQKTLA